VRQEERRRLRRRHSVLSRPSLGDFGAVSGHDALPGRYRRRESGRLRRYFSLQGLAARAAGTSTR
jgi:hypothetical protein